jgi:peptidyl-prolyl cis-trans isomerase SDCCAG10
MSRENNNLKVCQESRVSTVWCEGQDLRMVSNGSFNAYLLDDRPKLRRVLQRVSMQRRMVLEDDIKEYWGFYLLKNSFVKLSVCSRHEGASFIVVKVILTLLTLPG